MSQKTYTTPIDVSRVRDENGVKKIIKGLLDQHGWFHWAAAAGGYSAGGVHDRLCLKDGVFLTIEAKFGTRRPTALQNGFAAQIMANSSFAFLVNERNIDHLAWWLESFNVCQAAETQGLPIPDDHGARMMNAMVALVQGWGTA